MTANHVLPTRCRKIWWIGSNSISSTFFSIAEYYLQQCTLSQVFVMAEWPPPTMPCKSHADRLQAQIPSWLETVTDRLKALCVICMYNLVEVAYSNALARLRMSLSLARLACGWLCPGDARGWASHQCCQPVCLTIWLECFLLLDRYIIGQEQHYQLNKICRRVDELEP